jgi:hypothetical protein
MFSTKLSVLAAVVSFGLFATGCAAESSEQTASSDSEVRTTQTFAEVDVQDGTFKLYEDPTSKPSDACDIHTVLTITHEESGVTATLRDVVTGVCFLYVKPNERSYRLSWETNRCGTQTFSGETAFDGETHHIAITDYRRSLCENKSKAEVVVDEYDQSGVVTTRYTQQ